MKKRNWIEVLRSKPWYIHATLLPVYLILCLIGGVVIVAILMFPLVIITMIAHRTFDIDIVLLILNENDPLISAAMVFASLIIWFCILILSIFFAGIITVIKKTLKRRGRKRGNK